MLYVGILLASVAGFLLVNMISVRFRLCEKIGLSFPVGMLLVTGLMLAMDAVDVPLTRVSVLTGVSIAVAGLVAATVAWRPVSVSTLRSWLECDWRGWNAVWLVVVVLTAYVACMNFEKCMFWPPFDRDSLAAFETIGYVIAQEHTLKGLSVFNEDYMVHVHGAAGYVGYAPMLQLSYGFVYMLGAETSKVVPGLMYVFFLLAFYAATRRATGRSTAALLTLFVLLTPEMLAWSSLSMTNVVHAIFASLGIIYLSQWLRGRQRRDFWLSALLLAGNGFCRMEGVVFIGAAVCIVAIDAVRRRAWREVLWFGLTAGSTFVIWNVFLRATGLAGEQIVGARLFWDTEKMALIGRYLMELYRSTTYYGATFVVFVAGTLVNIWMLIRRRDNLWLLGAIGLSMLLYAILLYQIDFSWDSIDNVMRYSAKRFMFCFIPMLWYCVGTNRTVAWVMTRLETVLALRTPRPATPVQETKRPAPKRPRRK
jgi:hypothetical protein